MTHPTDALRLVPVPYVVLSEAAGLLDCEGYGPLALTLNNLLGAAPASPMPEGGGNWSAIRNAFVRHAEAFVKASRYEEASAIADKAAREIQGLVSPLPAAPSGGPA